MTSKEALDEMFDLLNYEQTGICGDKNLYRIIAKDLDRLEMLEKAIKIINDALELYVDFYEVGVESRSSFIEYEDSELLKEVLGYE